MGQFLGGQQNMQPTVGGIPSGGGQGANLLTALPGILNSFKGVNTKAQSNIAGQQQRVANAMINPSNPLYQQLYGQNRQNIQQQGAAGIAAAGDQNRLLSSMGRTPLFAGGRQGEAEFRQSVNNQQNAGVQANDLTESQLGAGMGGLNSALAGANARNASQYGASRVMQGSQNQTPIGFNSIAQLLRGGGY